MTGFAQALLLLPLLLGEADDPTPLRIAVLPVLDQTGGVFHEAYGVNLRRLVVDEMLEAGLQPIFLNCGPAFDFSDRELVLELANEAQTAALLEIRLAGVVERSRWKRLEEAQKEASTEAELIAALEGAVPPNAHRADVQSLVKSGKGHLIVASSVAPLSDLDSRSTFVVANAIRRNFLKDLARLDPKTGINRGSTSKFTDTAPGRAAKKSAEEIAEQLSRQMGGEWTREEETENGVSDRCGVSFGVRFLPEGRTSRSYTAAINGKEATFRIRNGRVTLQMPSGHFHAVVTIQDAPYGLRIQDIYDANAFIDCSAGDAALFLEIGALGEAVLRREAP